MTETVTVTMEITGLRHLGTSVPVGTGPVRLRRFKDERAGRRRVEGRFGEHLEGDPE
jgi:hypothetical protein